MDINILLQQLVSFFQNPDGFLKIAFILILLLFLVFTVVLARQISLLIELVDQVTFSPVFKLIANTLSIFTILLLIAVIFV